MSSSANSALQLSSFSRMLRTRLRPRLLDSIAAVLHHPRIQWVAAVIGGLAVNLALGQLFGRFEDWSSFATQSLLVLATIVVFRTMGDAALWATIGGLCFAWHPLLVETQGSRSWAAGAFLVLVILAALIRFVISRNALFTLLIAILLAWGSPINWLTAVLTSFAVYSVKALPSYATRTNRTHPWKLIGLLGVVVGISLLKSQLTIVTDFSSRLTDSTTNTVTSLGPLSWFDRQGLLSACLPALPSDLAQIGALGYFGMVPILLAFVATWPIKSRPFDRQNTVALALLMLGLVMLWPLCGNSSFQSQMTRLFAVITLEKETSVWTQHLVGFLSVWVYAIPLIVVFTGRGLIDRNSRALWPWLLAVIIGMIWWTTTPADFHLPAFAIDPGLISFTRVSIALTCAIATVLGLQRLFRITKLRWLGGLAVLFALVIVAFDMIP